MSQSEAVHLLGQARAAAAQCREQLIKALDENAHLQEQVTRLTEQVRELEYRQAECSQALERQTLEIRRLRDTVSREQEREAARLRLREKKKAWKSISEQE